MIWPVPHSGENFLALPIILLERGMFELLCLFQFFQYAKFFVRKSFGPKAP